MKKELIQFEISKIGFQKLGEFDYDLLEKARTVVMWYLEESYGKTSENKLIALNEASDWCGFKIEDRGTHILLNVGGLPKSDAVFYTTLYAKFKNAIETLKIDEHDELGLVDEIIQVSNLMLKYKHVIVLKRKKKNIFDRIKNIFS